MIEVQVLAHSNRPPVTDSDDEDKDTNATSNQVETKSSDSEHLKLKTRIGCDGSTFSIVLARNGGELSDVREDCRFYQCAPSHSSRIEQVERFEPFTTPFYQGVSYQHF